MTENASSAALALSALLLAGGCQIDDDSALPDPNRVTYHIDGVSVPAGNVISLTVLDETKNLVGPNTGLYLEAGEPAEVPDRVLGDKLRLNLPRGMSAGTHPVRFARLPPREHLWLGYRHSTIDQWFAYDGVITVHSAGGVGSRFRASFESVKLSNSCGEQRLVEHGEIDVLVGSEDTFPASEIEQSEEWTDLDATEQLENNLVADVDGTVYGCEFVDFAPAPVPAEDSDLGRDETVLNVLGICSCQYDPATGRSLWTSTLAAYFPSEGHGTVSVDRQPFYLYVLVDMTGTPEDFADDEVWYSGVMELEYRAIGTTPRHPIDIKLTRPIDLFYVDRSTEEWVLDTSESITLRHLHVYGRVDP